MKMTFQPKKRSRAKKKKQNNKTKISTAGGRKVLAARRAKGRKKLSA